MPSPFPETGEAKGIDDLKHHHLFPKPGHYKVKRLEGLMHIIYGSQTSPHYLVHTPGISAGVLASWGYEPLLNSDHISQRSAVYGLHASVSVKPEINPLDYDDMVQSRGIRCLYHRGGIYVCVL